MSKASAYIAAVGLVTLSLVGAAFGSRSLGHQIDSESARGEAARVVAEAAVDSPKEFTARVGASPHQQIAGRYIVACSRGSDEARKSGALAGTAPIVKKLPLPDGDTVDCRVRASAQLRGEGRINLKLYTR
jgi:hypothetical protein